MWLYDQYFNYSFGESTTKLLNMFIFTQVEDKYISSLQRNTVHLLYPPDTIDFISNYLIFDYSCSRPAKQ